MRALNCVVSDDRFWFLIFCYSLRQQWIVMRNCLDKVEVLDFFTFGTHFWVRIWARDFGTRTQKPSKQRGCQEEKEYCSHMYLI